MAGDIHEHRYNRGMLKPAAVVSLDLDDTLWDIGHVIRRAEREVGAWLSANAPGMAAFLAATDIAALRASLAASHPDQQHDFGFMRKAIYRRAAEHSGEPVDLAAAALDEFNRWRNTVDLFDDVEPALAAMANSHRLIALTNGTADLAEVGIGRHFVATVNAARAGVAKPHPAIFALAAELTGQSPDCVIHVGDDPHLDVAGARAAGMQAVWVNRPGVPWPDDLPPPDLAVGDLAELAEALSAG